MAQLGAQPSPAAAGGRRLKEGGEQHLVGASSPGTGTGIGGDGSSEQHPRCRAVGSLAPGCAWQAVSAARDGQGSALHPASLSAPKQPNKGTAGPGGKTFTAGEV